MKKRMNRYSAEDQMNRFGITKEEAEEKIKKIKSNINKWNLYSIEDQMKRYEISREEAEEKIKKIKNVNVFSITWQMNRFNITKEEAEEKIKKIKDKLIDKQNQMSEFDFNSMIPSKKEHWIKKGFNEIDAIEKVKENIKNATNNCNIYTKDVKENPENHIGRSNTNIEYYIKKGYSLEESKKLLKERQTTFTIKKCIEKHGIEYGQIVWKERQEKWNKSLLKNGNLKVGWSNVSQLLFNEICNHLDNIDFIFYGNKNKEFSITTETKGYLYDFADIYNMKIIEFNGDIYHANPLLYKEEDKPNPFKDLTSIQLWEKDKIKLDLAKSKGFDVLVIWESEYRKEKETVIKKCLQFLIN